jgi:hypothetical protein
MYAGMRRARQMLRKNRTRNTASPRGGGQKRMDVTGKTSGKTNGGRSEASCSSVLGIRMVTAVGLAPCHPRSSAPHASNLE